uniref:NDUFA2 n=1 Tax=Euglena gracilis TaxID=3039 RepID=UPI002FE4FB74|eukprot:EG_transcript_28989
MAQVWRSRLSCHFRKLRVRYPAAKLPEAAAINWATYLDVPSPANLPAADLNKALEAMRRPNPALASSRGVREFVQRVVPELEAENPFCPLIVDKFDPEVASQFPSESTDPTLHAHFLDGTQVNVPLANKSAAEIEDILADLVKLAGLLQPQAPLEGDNLPVEDTIYAAASRPRFPNYSRHAKQARLGDESTEM